MKKIYLFFLTFCTALLSGLSSTADAHSVQVAYCVSCNGDLRIFVEHWHGTESLSSTTMTISLTINSVVSNQTASPQSGIYNTPLAGLPGCSTPIVVAAACAGQANTYNNWVVFDYTGIPCGVPCSFTIISGNTVFTQDGCGMYPLTVNFTVPCGSSTLTDLFVCDGVPTSPIVVPVGTTWTNSNPAIGLPASGVGDIPSFIPIGPTANATISYNNSCVTSNFNIFVTPAPTVAFSADTVCSGSPTSFVNSSSAGPNATWNWDFGDATSSTLQSPGTHTYSTPGNYTVVLTATDSGGCTASLTQTIVVVGQPIPSFTAANVCDGTSTLFNNTSTFGNSYSWDFGTGTSAVQNPSFTFPGPGTYSVELVVSGGIGCTDSITQSITVDPLPVASFIYNQQCGYALANFSSTSSASLPAVITATDWDFGDPASGVNNTSSLLNPSHTFTSNGTYTVTMIATSTGGCTHTATQIISVSPPPTSLFSATTVCQNNAMQFTNQSLDATTYAWDFGDIGSGDTSSALNPNFTYANSGNYTVTLITNPGPCSDTSTLSVTVWAGPQVAFIGTQECLGFPTLFTDQTVISSGSISNWSWNFGVGSTLADTSNLPNPSYQYPAAGTYNVTLTCTSANGCVTSLTVPVIVDALPVASFNSTTACLGALTNLNDLSVATSGVITNWSWDFGDGSPIATTQNPSHVFPNDSTYNTTLIVTNTAGCLDTFNLSVVINPLPIVAYTSDIFAGCPILCVDFLDQSTIASGSITGWVWDFGDSSTVSTSQNPNHCYSQTGVYTVTLTATSNSGCVTTLVNPNMITVHPVPVASFSATPYVTTVLTPTILFNDLSQGSPVSWSWNFGEPSTLSDTSNIQNPSYMYSSEFGALYDVNLIITNQYGCVDDTTIQVTIEPDFSFFIPDAFTPNDDGVNDFFFGAGYGITKYEIWIFDRWGNLIFTTKDINQGWDGSVLGKGGDLAQIDTYIWKVFLTDVLDVRHKYIGHVSLIR